MIWIRSNWQQEQVTNPDILRGDFSCYSGYCHGYSFDDCARHLSPDRDDVDRLIIGNLYEGCFLFVGDAAILRD